MNWFNRQDLRLNAAFAALVVVLFGLSLMVGPANLSLDRVIDALFRGEGVAGIIVRDIRLPRTMLALLIGATFGLSRGCLAGIIAQPAGGARAVRRPAGRGRRRRAGHRLRPGRCDLLCRAARRHRGSHAGDRGSSGDRRPPRQPDGDHAGRACARELRRGRRRTHPESGAQSLCRDGGCLLAARLAAGPQQRSSSDCFSLSAGQLGDARQERGRVPRANARRGCRRLARRQHRSHPPGRRRGCRLRRGRCSGHLRIDRLRRPGGASSGPPPRGL